ncbi:protein GDAP2 [Tanacetum coccineum]
MLSYQQGDIPEETRSIASLSEQLDIHATEGNNLPTETTSPDGGPPVITPSRWSTSDVNFPPRIIPPPDDGGYGYPPDAELQLLEIFWLRIFQAVEGARIAGASRIIGVDLMPTSLNLRHYIDIKMKQRTEDIFDSIALPEVVKHTCGSVQKLLSMCQGNRLSKPSRATLDIPVGDQDCLDGNYSDDRNSLCLETYLDLTFMSIIKDPNQRRQEQWEKTGRAQNGFKFAKLLGFGDRGGATISIDQ